MQGEHLPETEALVGFIWDAYNSFIGKPGLIGKIDAFNDTLHREMSKIYSLQPRFVGKSNKPLLTADAYKEERDNGLEDSVISAKYRFTSPNQIKWFADAYDGAKKRELKEKERVLRYEERGPSLLEVGLRKIFAV